MVNELASKIEQDNATQIILVKNDSRQGNLEGLGSLSYTPSKAYRTAVLGYQDRLRVNWFGIRYCTIGLFQIIILISILASPYWWRVLVSAVERVSSVGVTDVSSLVVTRRRWCFVRVFLVLCLCDAVGLFHRPYK